ncbi:hypothetical protein [Streptomyces rubellomurinus]|uniref:Uncharacterized protein n=1 Tax=Streptomyces rubellomurinus (strain ATCC 31215) TaxID=359131 RepID=A0A0F2TJT9_STRR3|nr:hypothetical protein [Streptomyces rubellomurinus]KJS61972.1 hypothetical protein VM95_11505 [Streptomyces rubellomurinus]
MDLLSIATRFPLAPRHRPPCPPLPVRIQRLDEQARTAEAQGDATGASAVHNLAALIACDLGLHGLARRLCADHTRLFFAAAPLAAKDACHSLAPVVNVANLLIRQGDADQAFDVLRALHEAVTTRTDTTVAGIAVPVTALTANDEDHQEVVQWTRGTLLVDGSRALTRAGRWEEAHAHLERPGMIGRRMFEGRQIAVLATALGGDIGGALALLAATLPGDPWEATVTACLTALCQPVTDPTEMLYSYEQHAVDPRNAVFNTRLGLALIDTVGGTDHPRARDAARFLIARTLEHGDGYAARDVLAHSACASALTCTEQQQLAETVVACGFDRMELPTDLHDTFGAALDRSASALTHSLTARC